MRRVGSYTYILLSLAFIAVNLFTICHLTPWIDEVMMLDTSYNAAVHGTWETRAWYRVAGQYPFSTYPPLYQMLAAVWIWLFGGSLVVVRSLNLLITFALGGACLRLMRGHGLRLTPWTAALFTVLLWGTSEMAWMYRNGRPDMLCALLVVFAIHAIDRHRQSKSSATCIAVVIASALLSCAGLQTAVYLLMLWLFFCIVVRERRKEAVCLLTPLLSGCLLGVFFVALFMYAHGRLMAFASSIVQYSATLSQLALAVLPWAGETFGFQSAPYTEKLLELKSETSFLQRFASIAEYRSFLILAVVALVAYISSFRNHLRLLLSDMGFLLLLFALCIPFLMSLAGRFAIYYRWMAFLPLLVAILSITARRQRWCAAFGVLAAIMTISGIRSMMPDTDWNYASLRSFVQRQHFKPSDAVVCPFSTFYEMKGICDTCYFAGIFPTEFIGHVDYVIEAPDGGSFDLPITGYVNNLKTDTTVVLTAIDHCEHPSLTLYRVQTRHE